MRHGKHKHVERIARRMRLARAGISVAHIKKVVARVFAAQKKWEENKNERRPD